MKLIITVLLSAVCLTHTVYGVDYCATSCGADNIGCNKNDELASTCSNRNASIYKFNAQEIQLLLDQHNDYRNAICNGSVSGFEPCARTAKMVWDEQLAYLAGMNTRTCELQYDSCHNTEKFKSAGQNVAGIGSSSYPSADSVIRGVVLTFYNQKVNANMNDINSFEYNGKAIYLFTQLLWSNAIAVGCGATRFTKDGYQWMSVTCNYAASISEGSPVYVSSTTGGSGCTTGTDATYNALCKDTEPIDANTNPTASGSSGSPTVPSGSGGSGESSGSGESDGSDGIDYSTKDYCGTNCGTNHVACNKKDEPQSTCTPGTNPVIHRFNEQEAELLLDLHNDYRNAISNGSLSRYSPCARMAKMVWDDELVYLAGLNTRSCLFEHDACHNTDRFDHAGQNLAWYGTTSTDCPNVEFVIRFAVNFWFVEHEYANMDDINKFSRLYADPEHEIAHFTQLVWANATRVGCGATCFTKDGYRWLDIACNYATTNIDGSPVYLTSTTGGSGCTKGTDSKYPALCREDEPLDPNFYHPPL